jgi:3-deoxy-manno-octulosonate cytidylyltransferase (CMP-KDO synthetase)
MLLFVVRPAGCSESIRDPLQNHRHTVAVIPARYASTRFPGKTLADIAGRPMIEHVYGRAAAARNVDAVIVATDDRRIADAVTRFGGTVRMTRPDHLTGTDRLAEVAVDLDCDLVVNVQGDEPLIEPDTIDAAIEPFRHDPDLLMSTVCTRILTDDAVDDPNVVKVVTDRRGFALYFSRSPIPYVRGVAGTSIGPYKHLGLYVYRRDFLHTIAALAPTALERIQVVETRHDSIGIDTPEDLERVRRLLTADARA